MQGELRGLSPRRIWGLVAVTAVLAVTFGDLLGPFDFLTFFHAGRQVLEGESPYPSVGSAVFRSGHGFVYPLFVAWLFAPLALFPQVGAEIVYGCASVVAIVVSCRMLGRRDFAAPALVMVCSTTIIGLQMGTVNAFLLLGLACAWYWRDSHPVLSGAVLGLAAGAKLFLLPVLIWPFLRRRWSAGGSTLATVLVLLGGGGLLGSESPVSYLHLLSKLAANEVVSSWSLSSLFQSVGLSRTGSSAAAVAVVVAGLAVLLRRRRVLADERVLGAVVVLSLLMSPIVWSSYLLLLVVPLLLVDPGDDVLAAAAVASWVLVTPDAASPFRVVVGVALAVTVAALVARRHLGALTRLVRNRPRVRARWLLLAVLMAAVIVALPSPVRSPIPALAAMAVVGFRCLRTVRGRQLQPG